MSDLTDFLLARIAEDEEGATHEAIARASAGTVVGGPDVPAHTVEQAQAAVIDAHRVRPWSSPQNPARVLAECDAKRRIVEMHAANSTAYPPRFDQFDPHSITVCASCGESREPFHKPGCTTLRLLALPYADHSDYDEEWRP